MVAMPWCAGCDRFLSPATVTAAGDCPRCGAPVDPGRARAPEPNPPADADGGPSTPAGGVTRAETVGTARAEDADDEGGDDTLPLPWHFKLLVGAIALYLGWRAVQGVEWVVHRF